MKDSKFTETVKSLMDQTDVVEPMTAIRAKIVAANSELSEKILELVKSVFSIANEPGYSMTYAYQTASLYNMSANDRRSLVDISFDYNISTPERPYNYDPNKQSVRVTMPTFEYKFANASEDAEAMKIYSDVLLFAAALTSDELNALGMGVAALNTEHDATVTALYNELSEAHRVLQERLQFIIRRTPIAFGTSLEELVPYRYARSYRKSVTLTPYFTKAKSKTVELRYVCEGDQNYGETLEKSGSMKIDEFYDVLTETLFNEWYTK